MLSIKYLFVEVKIKPFPDVNTLTAIKDLCNPNMTFEFVKFALAINQYETLTRVFLFN